ncbi:MAG: lipopolysaccharide biosynthesis protein [Thiobacillaceae bacterium]|nr:lipopolysaccharide biosynthesis protein [Thiobacillaceae bacterium]
MRKGLSAVLARALRWRPGGYLRASAALTGWLLLRALAQALVVVLLARWLGAQAYGLYVTALAAVSFFIPLASLGLGGVLLREGARSPETLDRLLGKVIRLWAAALVLTSLAAFGLLHVLLAGVVATATLAVFAVAEVAAVSFIELIARAEQARQRTARFGALHTGLILARLIVLLPLIALTPQVETWLWAQACVSLAYSAAVAAWGLARHPPHLRAPVGWHLAAAGLPYAAGALSHRLQAEFNKPLLARLGYEQAAQFGVAQRVMELVSLPLQAMQEALWPRLYSGRHSPRQLALVALTILGAALIGGLAAAMAAPLLPTLLGPGYESSSNLLLWIAFLPALQLARNQLTAQVVACERTPRLLLVYAVGAGAGMLLAWVLIPRFGMPGAVAALYLNELLNLLVLGLILLHTKNG